MGFKEPNTPPDQPVDPEHIEEELSPEEIEALMEAAILYGFKHNEGQNAVIFQVEVGKLPEEALHKIFTAKGKEIPTGRLASKVIKVYASLAAAKEAENHQRVFDLVGANYEEGMARIPEPHVHAEIDIKTDELKERLEAAGIQSHSGKVGMMMMDYIKGIDLVTHVYREIIKNLPEDEFKLNYPDTRMIKEELMNDPDAVDFARLEEAVVFALAIKGPKAGEDFEARIRRDLGNRKLVFDAFQDLNLTIDPEILERIRKTVKVMNDNHVYHNDLHERNVMIETDEDGELVDVYLIDFDKVSSSQDESWGGDRGVATEYRKLTKTRAEQKQAATNKEVQDAVGFVEKIKKHRTDEWEEFETQIEDLIGKKFPKLMKYLDGDISHFAMRHGNIAPEQLSLGIVLEIAKKHPEVALEFVEYKRSNPGSHDRPFINLLIKHLPQIKVHIEEKD